MESRLEDNRHQSAGDAVSYQDPALDKTLGSNAAPKEDRAHKKRRTETSLEFAIGVDDDDGWQHAHDGDDETMWLSDSESEDDVTSQQIESETLALGGGVGSLGHEQHDEEGMPEHDLPAPSLGWDGNFAFNMTSIPTASEWDLVTNSDSYPTPEPWTQATPKKREIHYDTETNGGHRQQHLRRPGGQ